MRLGCGGDVIIGWGLGVRNSKVEKWSEEECWSWSRGLACKISEEPRSLHGRDML